MARNVITRGRIGPKRIDMNNRLAKRHIDLTTQYIIIVCVLLLVVSLVLGLALMSRSKKNMRQLINQHMVSVADTAAAAINGDVLEGITAEDACTYSENYLSIVHALRMVQTAQESKDIKYIYTVKKEGDHFVFTVDPDTVKPAEYGEEVVHTDKQESAWAGKSGVDEETYEDEWGCFYTAWSPVRNSHGDVVGLVGVDFSADWYNSQTTQITAAIVIVCVLSLVIGFVITFLLTNQLRRRIRAINDELSTLSENVDKLSDEIKVHPGQEAVKEEEHEENSDAIGAIGDKIHAIQNKLRAYIEYAEKQAYTDSMTGVSNKTAYLARIKELNREINAGTAAFATIVFDVNGLKRTNDNYGHECGDYIIVDAARIIRRVFDKEQIYRIGGDEFITITDAITEEELQMKFDRLAAEVAHFNEEEKRYAMTLSFSWGGAIYRPGVDAAFKEVFKRADQAMYFTKEDYYQRCGNPRNPTDGNKD